MSRWGGFKKGKDKYSSKWSEMKSPSALREESVASTPNQFSYVEGKGVWNLRSTTEFPKSNQLVPISLTFIASASAVESVAVPLSANAGDLAVLYASEHNDTVSSGNTLPLGWITVREDFDSSDSVMVSGYKILQSSDLGTSVRTIEGSNSTTIMVFRPSRAINSLATFSVNGQATISDPSSQTINMSLAPSYNAILAVAFMSATTSLVESVPGSMALVDASSSQHAFYQIFNSEDILTNLTVDMPDEGDNVMQSWGLAIN